MLLATISSIVKQWNQNRSPSSDEQIQKTWCAYTMEFSHKEECCLQENNGLFHPLSETSQAQKDGLEIQCRGREFTSNVQGSGFNP